MLLLQYSSTSEKIMVVSINQGEAKLPGFDRGQTYGFGLKITVSQKRAGGGTKLGILELEGCTEVLSLLK